MTKSLSMEETQRTLGAEDPIPVSNLAEAMALAAKEFVIFNSTMLAFPRELPQHTQEEIKNEPMLFNCDVRHAYDLGGPITREFLSALTWDWHEEPCVIDTRVHMLMPNWFPCIPGWHHDDVPRTRADGQPNYEIDQDRATHIMALIGPEICQTEFAVSDKPITLPLPKRGVIYGVWDPIVDQMVADNKLQLLSIKSHQLISFDDRALHRGVKATGAGWRWFGRITRHVDKDGNSISGRGKRTNELRRQVQVYLENPSAGW